MRLAEKVVIVTGSSGLVGAAAVRRFDALGHRVVGVDNDLRSYFFGSAASTSWNLARLREDLPGYDHRAIDIRNEAAIGALFAEFGADIRAVIHCAGQPSHDWASREPQVDFAVNATGTLVLLEAARDRALPITRPLIDGLSQEQRAKIEEHLQRRGRSFDADRAAARLAWRLSRRR